MTALEGAPPGWVGRGVPSRAAPRLVRGAGRYTADVHLLRELTMVLLRSPHPHARIRAIDASAARALAGVHAVVTGRDLTGRVGPMEYVWALPGQRVAPGPPLALDVVRHVGEPVVAVVARDQYAAEDAAELVSVEYEPLPAVTTPRDALASDAPLLHPEWGTNVEVETVFPPPVPGVPPAPDPAEALAGAYLTVRETWTVDRVAATPVEPRAVVCDHAPGPDGGELTVWTSTQGPHMVRRFVASALGRPEHRVRVIAPDVGGGFGMKTAVYPEEILVPWLATTLERPVRWVAQPDEGPVADTPSRDQEMDLEVGFDADGRILGLRAAHTLDLGSAPTLHAGATGWVTGASLTGPYAVPAVDIRGTAVVTNKTPLGAFRGYGQPEANFPVERTLDVAARRLGLDPLEIRRRNLVPASAMPFATPTGTVIDSGDYAQMLDLLTDRPAYRAAVAERDAARAAGRPAGLGVAFYTENTNLGPSRIMPLLGVAVGGWDAATVRVEPDGRVHVATGQTPIGQGIETALAQTAADAFALGIDDVAVRTGDTDTAFTAYAGGSRGAGVGGSAVLAAAGRVVDKMRRIAAHLLEADADDVELSPEGFRVVGGAGDAVPHAVVAAAAYRAADLPEGMEPGLVAEAGYDPPSTAFAYGVVAALVELDPDTGQVTVRRLVLGHDCGTQLNPAIVASQVVGGAVQGIGAALSERLVYDDGGHPLVTSPGDYLLTPATAVPEMDLFHTEHPSPFSANGAKGVGESGVIAVPAAVVNAIRDALPPGAPEPTRIPVLPATVLEALDSLRTGTPPR